jgi:hypothetical protein
MTRGEESSFIGTVRTHFLNGSDPILAAAFVVDAPNSQEDVVNSSFIKPTDITPQCGASCCERRLPGIETRTGGIPEEVKQ